MSRARAGALLLAVLLVSTAGHGGNRAPDEAVPAEHDEVPPVISLIIDDLGYDPALARRTLALPRPFAVAILPESPLARAVHESADLHDIDIMLHMPMAGSSVARGYDIALSVGMDADDIRAMLQRALALVPDAIAVNNHEGSGITGDAEAMQAVMETLRAAGGLAFVDSRTTADTVAEQAAMEAGLATTRRNVFLDHDPAPAAVERAVDEWLRLAQREGCALAIGHPRRVTLEVLERRLAEIGEEFDRVDLRTYIERCGHTP